MCLLAICMSSLEKCLSADEWIRKLWYIYTMEYYAAIKKNTFESVLMRWIKLEIELPYDPAIPLLGIHTKDFYFYYIRLLADMFAHP